MIDLKARGGVMSVTRAALAVAFAVGAGPAFAGDHAQPRGGGGESSHSSSAGQQHHSSGGGQASSSSSDSSGSSSGSSYHSSESGRSHQSTAQPLTEAERRHPRAGTGHAYRGSRGRNY